MLTNQTLLTSFPKVMISPSGIITLLLIVVSFFAILLIIGIIKSNKLEKANEQLEASNYDIDNDDEKPYQDFTDGHIYQK